MSQGAAEKSQAGLTLTLDEVEDAEVALLCVYGENKVERGVMPVDELRPLPPLRNDPFQVVAERVRPLRHLLEYALYHAFLRFFAHLARQSASVEKETREASRGKRTRLQQHLRW